MGKICKKELPSTTESIQDTLLVDLRIVQMLPYLYIVLLCISCVLCQPSGYHYDPNTPPIEYTTPSPGFNTFATLPEQAVDASGDFIDPSLNLNYGLWDDEINAHVLDPVHPHAVGLPFPTSRSRECARVKEKVRQKKAGVEALLPWIHESLHESVIAPSISAPSVNNRWYENEFGQQGEEEEGDNYQDAEDGEEVDQQTQQAFNALDDLPEGNFYEASRSSFRHEQGIGGMLDALPSHLLQEHDSGRRSSVHFENYAGSEAGYHSIMYGNPSASGKEYGAGASMSQQDHTQDFLQSWNQAELPPRPPMEATFAPPGRPRKGTLLAKTMETMNDGEAMQAWEIYKQAMNAPLSQPDPKDGIWKRFIKYRNVENINDLNSGNPARIARAKANMSHSKSVQMDPCIADPSTWSDWAKANYRDEAGLQRLILKCCQLARVSVDDGSARTYWRNRLLTQSKPEIIGCLKSGINQHEMWAVGQLAGQTTAAVLEREQRQAAANARANINLDVS